MSTGGFNWFFGDDTPPGSVDYTTLEGIGTIPVADPFEKWTDEERNTQQCPPKLNIHDNRFRLLGKCCLINFCFVKITVFLIFFNLFC